MCAWRPTRRLPADSPTAPRATFRRHAMSEHVILLHGLWMRGFALSMLHRRLIPERSDRATSDPSEARLREKVTPLGAEFISAWDTLCNADGCLARIGDSAKDISASDQVHLTEKGSIFLIQSIIDRVLAPHQ